jgi:hypothetical protein
MKNIFKTILLTSTICFILTQSAQAQDVCPADTVCLPQQTANKLLDSVNQLVEAKTLIAKLLTERGASDAVIASANRVIEDYKVLDGINTLQVTKYKDMMALYERVIVLYQGVVEKLEKQLNKGKSAWDKLVGILKTVVSILAGAAIGGIVK